MFYTDEEHGYAIYEKKKCLTFEKNVYPVVKRITEEVRQNYPEALKDGVLGRPGTDRRLRKGVCGNGMGSGLL